MNHSRKGGMTGNNTVLGSYSCSWLWTFSPRMLVVQCPSESFTNEILNPRDRVNWVHFGRVAYPLCQAVGSQEIGSYCTGVTTGRPPDCEGIPRKGSTTQH